MTSRYTPTLRDRLIARRGLSPQATPINIPLTGIIAPEAVAEIHDLAVKAQKGDKGARDVLHDSFRLRLGRMGYVLRPWPNTPETTGLWDRDDVNQEGWIVFAELLHAWDGESHFVKYLFGRFPWRLRDRVLRGIGKPLPPIGETRIPESMLATTVYAGDDEQPESALLASGLLESLINQALGSDELTTLQSPQRGGKRDLAMSKDHQKRARGA